MNLIQKNIFKLMIFHDHRKNSTTDYTDYEWDT